ncbi:MAG: UvrD-helicase domain-containing protein [Gammaproteobacteria bacterium]|nr:UvrD-helicase domain-containing protein [Gammaproteobacteria bacterium]
MSNESDLLFADQKARNTALDVSRSFIVQAPAGAGKTELLIQRYLRLLACVDHPEEVLAITFTRKASAEMQYRVLQALKSARSGDRPVATHQQTTLEAATAVLKRDREMAWELVSNPGRMRIQTLDSLNAAISAMQPMSAGSGATHNAILADAEMAALYKSAAVLTLDQLVESGELREATEQVLLHVDNNTSLYVSYVARMLATRDQWLPFIGSGLVAADAQAELRARFENNIGGAVTAHLDRIRHNVPAELLPDLLELARYAAGNADGFEVLQGLHGLPPANVSALQIWRGLADLLLTREGAWRRTVTKLQGFPASDDGQKQRMLQLLADLRDAPSFCELLQDARDLPPVTYSDDQWSVLLALFRLLPLAVTELKRLFAERGVTDYIEVSLSAAAALGSADDPGDVALLLDYQLRHLLVDEMQDTSSAQYRMLEALTGGWEPGDGRTLFCVGDPMQSIYRFRNAEVGQFLLAKQSGIGHLALEPLTLRQNFRSGETLVNWFNAVFPRVLSREDDPSLSAVSYAAAVSVPQHAGQGQCVVHPVIGSDPSDEARHGCTLIEETLAAYPDDDMAVLVRGRSHLSRLLGDLRAAGLAYRAIEIDRLTDLPEIIDVLALTRALVHRGDRLAWLAILRSPWTGLDWTDLHALLSGAGDRTVWQLLHDGESLARLGNDGRLAVIRLRDVLGPAMRPARLKSLRDRVEQTWVALGGAAMLRDPNTVDNIYRYLDVVEGMEQGGTLIDVAQLEDALDHEYVSSDSDARLQVMTMHRAKGLQFDHVLLYGLGRVPARQDRSVLSWCDIPGAHGADEKIISPVGRRADVEGDPLHRYIEKVETGKYRHELGRLLYVACTRARKSLHLMGHVELPADGKQLRGPRSGSLLELLWPSVASDFANALQSARNTVIETSPAPWLNPVLRRFAEPYAVPEFHGLGKCGEVSAQPTDAAVEFYWVGAEARLAGTIVHRWLQLAANGRVSLAEAGAEIIKATSSRWLQSMGVIGASSETVIGRVEAALTGILADEKGRWLLSGKGMAELALTGVYEGELISVVLDRVRIDEQDRHWIVDYKTSSHEGGKLESFLEAEVERYRPQLKKYRQLYLDYAHTEARCALYFPLLQQFVEVPL